MSVVCADCGIGKIEGENERTRVFLSMMFRQLYATRNRHFGISAHVRVDFSGL